LDGAHDPWVGAAATDIAVHVHDDVIPRRVLVGGQQLGRLHDLARLAVAALGHLFGDPSFCSGWSLLADRPSMVVIDLPSTSDASVWHDRTALPSTCTVQAPHNPAPQPNLVPVIFRCSRITHKSGVSGAAAAVAALPLIVNATTNPSPQYCCDWRHSASTCFPVPVIGENLSIN